MPGSFIFFDNFIPYRIHNFIPYILEDILLNSKESHQTTRVLGYRYDLVPIRSYREIYVILNSYLRPCMAAYAEAKRNGDAPTDEEYENAKFLYDYFVHVESNTASTEEITERAYSYIEGFSSDMNFQFHDSKVIDFSHDCTSAQLHLQYDDTIVTILFEEIYEIEVNSVDPEVTWISDFDCYPTFRNPDLLIFDVGFYKIQCRKIKLVQQ